MNEKIWEQFDLSEVNRLVERALGSGEYNFSDIVEMLMLGEFDQALDMMKRTFWEICIPGIYESKSLLFGVLLLGLFSMLLQYSFGVVKSRQVGDLAYFLVYLILVLLLLQSFGNMLETAKEVLELCKQFITVLVPAYCLSISLSVGVTSAAVHYELLVLLLLGIEYILSGLLLPLTQSYVFLVIMDGLDEGHRMKDFIKLMERGISWAIKLSLTVTVLLCTMQNAVTSQIDGVQKTVFQKAVGAIPGIGDMSESVTQLIMGSAGVIKSSIGATAMIFLFLLILRPVWKLFCISVTMKVAAACIRMMGQSRMSDTVSKIGESGILVMRIVMCSVISFCVCVAMTMYVMKGGG